VGVNRNRTRASQRFAAVHELAHPYLGHHGDISFVEEEEDPVLHTEADNFATEMLTPKDRIISLAYKHRDPIPLLYQIMRVHDVSLEMACRRMIELEIYRGAFVCFSELQPFFAYNSKGFSLEAEIIYDLPKIERGCLIAKHETIKGVAVTCYIQRFRQSGKFLAAWVEDSTANPESLYEKLLDKWFGNKKPGITPG